MAGFSLLEMMVVVAVGSVLAAIAVSTPTFTSNANAFQNNKIQVTSFLQQARNVARSKHECVTVTFNGGTLNYTSYTMAAPCVAPFAGQDLTSTTTIDPQMTVTAPSTGNPLIFNTSGGTDYAANSQITISQGSTSSNITIYPLLGQIRAP